MTTTPDIPTNDVLADFPEAKRFGYEAFFSHTQWRRNFVKDWQDGHIEWLPSGTDPVVVRRIGELYADRLVEALHHVLDVFYSGWDEEEHLLRDLLRDMRLIPEENPFDERCDDCEGHYRCDGCEVIVPDGEGHYPDGDEGRRVCADCAKGVS